MNPMQGPWNTGGSSTEVNQSDDESIHNAANCLNCMLNQVDNEYPNNTMPSGRPTYASSSSHAAQNPNWWRFGESSSISGSSDQVNSSGFKTNHLRPPDGAHHLLGHGSGAGQLGLGGMISPGGAYLSHGDSYIRNRPSFLHSSSSNPMSQHVNVSMDMDMDNNSYGAQTSGVIVGRNNRGSSLGSSIQAAGESSSGPATSSGGWGSSCKRMALEGVPGHSFSSETPEQTGNGAFHIRPGLAQYGASSSLGLAVPSQSSSSVTNHFNQPEPMLGSGGGRMVATNVFPSTRNTDTLSRPGRRLNPRQPQESVSFSLSQPGSAVYPAGSLQQNLPITSPFIDPLTVRSTSITGASTTGLNQTDVTHFPALTRNTHQFSWDASLSSRTDNISGFGMPVERFGPQWEAPRSNLDQPMFAPATEMRNPVHDQQSSWSFSRGNPGSSVDSPFVSRVAPSSAIHATWIPTQSPSLHNQTRIAELFHRSLFPSTESQSANHGGSHPLLPTGPPVSSNEVAMPSGSSSRSNRSRQRSSGLSLERHNDVLHLRHLGRGLASDSDGRNQLISEIRQVLNAMRRGENLLEDYMMFDPRIYQGMAEMQDRHRELRLDVDNMSYEELLALGERIGDVNTGLREEVIAKAMKHHKHITSDQDKEPCCICQEEYAEGDDLGTLECGHEFHKDCIKQWIMLKNICPICKTMALTT